MAAATDRLVGDVLDGRYEIIDRAGRGGMATVYKAKDRRLDRTVAVKVMREDFEDDIESAKRFDAEARAVAKLSDPHIVSVFDQGVDRGRQYIVMEYVDGTNLKALMVQQGALPPQRALRLLEDIAAGLAAAHTAGIVHRDVKPENVLLSKSGEVKVTDFGLARPSEAPTMTVAEAVLGSLSYVSPERLLHQAPVDFRSDIYSTGVVAYEMLTGRKPFTGDTPHVVNQHLTSDVPPPSSLLGRDAIPPWLDALVVACGRRDPDARPKDGTDLLRRLRLGLNATTRQQAQDPALLAEMSASSTGELPPAPPPPGALPPAAAAVQDDTPALPVQQPPAQRVPPSRHQIYRRRRIFAAVLAALVLVIASIGVWWLASGRFTKMPDVANLAQADADARVSAAGLHMNTTTDYSETVATGHVIATDPKAGAKVKRGATVTAHVSKGQERYPVPKLEGLDLAHATSALQNSDLTLGQVTTEYSETVAEGLVIRASQDEGAKLMKGTKVDLVVSQGRKPIPITDSTGASAADTIAALQAAGLTVVRVDAYSDTVPAGVVIGQDPPSATLFGGDTVTITASLGPLTNYAGSKADDAVAALTAAGLSPKRVDAYSDKVAPGVVISQNPTTGTIHKGDTITLTVSQGPQIVQVPNLIGKTSDEAKKELEALGLVAAYKFLGPDVIRQNIVAGTDPTPGTAVPVGTKVTLSIV